MNRFVPVQLKPGDLITNTAPESVGILNYQMKRDWRRLFDREVRREGYTYFIPNPNRPSSPQYTTDSDPIIFVHTARRPNGKVMTIKASKTTIWRYISLENEAYFTGDGTGNAYFEEGQANDPYFRQVYNDWETIGTGFSANGRRWEAVDVNGFMVMNNGVDLPVTFRIEDESVTPIFELRDLGVASVGTISQYNGILMCGDISTIKTDAFTALMATGARYDVFVDTASIDRFESRLLWSMPGLPRRFAASIPCSIDAGSRTVYFKWPTKSFSNQQTIIILGAGLNGGNLTADLVWIDPSRTKAYISQRAITTVTLDTSRVLGAEIYPTEYSSGGDTLNYPIPLDIGYTYHWEANSSGIVLHNGGALAPVIASGHDFVSVGNITLYGSFSPSAVGSIKKVGSVKNPTFGLIQSQDAVGSLVGFEDLEDDGGAVLKMAPLLNRLVVYKDASIFICTFVNQVNVPFAFEPVYLGNESIFYRSTLVSVVYQGIHFHFFAGRRGFYKFDFTTRNPVPYHREVENLFLDQVKGIDPNLVFAVDNALTKEIFLCFPVFDVSVDNAICFDYRYGTVSTTTASYTAAAMIQKPTATVPDQGENWFVMGTNDGLMLQYGFSETTQFSAKGTMYNRLGAGYDSILWSGRGHAGSAVNDSVVNLYLVSVNDLAGQINLKLLTHDSLNTETESFNYTYTPPLLASGAYRDTRQIPVPCSALSALFSDKITVSNPDVRCEILSRTLMAQELPTQTAGR